MFLLFQTHSPAPDAFNEEEYALIIKVLLADVAGFEARSEADRRAYICDMHTSRRSQSVLHITIPEVANMIGLLSKLSASERNAHRMIVIAKNHHLRMQVMRRFSRDGDTAWMNLLIILSAFENKDETALELIDIVCSDGKVHSRELFVPVMEKLHPSIRKRALWIMMHMEDDDDDDDGGGSEHTLNYVMIDWPCKEDVEFIVSVVGQLTEHQDKFKFIQCMLGKLCPYTNRAVEIDKDAYEMIIVPIVNAIHPTFQVRVLFLLIETMDIVPSMLVRDICHDFSLGDDDASLIHHYVNIHTKLCQSNHLRGIPNAIRDAGKKLRQLAIDCPDIKIDKESAALGCVICFENVRRVRFEPCGHFICCVGCCSRIKACPTCRTSIQSVGACFT